jgi:pimeloyl-ACP methyl ester carboxylesterase
LAGWVVTPRVPRGTVALFHGIRQNRTQTLGRTAFLALAGYRCVAFDHRAHGESMGKRTSFGFLEGRDVIAVLDLVRRLWPGQPRAALGISMGGAAICYAAGELRGLSAVVLESVYPDIASAFSSRIGGLFPAWFRQLSHSVIWVTERRLGLRLEQLAPVQHVAKLVPAPVLFITGSNDVHASPDDMLRLRTAYPGPGECWAVPEAGHRDVFAGGGTAYQERVLEFLQRHL